MLGSQGHSNEVSMSGGTAVGFHLQLKGFQPEIQPLEIDKAEMSKWHLVHTQARSWCVSGAACRYLR